MTWTKFYQNVERSVDALKCAPIYFRGHATASWKLVPALGRIPNEILSVYHWPEPRHDFETNLYSDFVAQAGDLIPASATSWDVLFLMQHHGVPTRLLDWTESFAIALFFALTEPGARPAIWLLNPYSLNAHTIERDEILDVVDLAAGYDEYFLQRSREFSADAIALQPPLRARRLSQQKAAFTLHGDLTKPLERGRKAYLRKVPIPRDAIEGAWRYLELIGISEYSLFPDLDGLARDLKRRYLHRRGKR